MIQEFLLLSSFVGIVGLLLWKVFVFTRPNFIDKPPYGVWVPLISLIGFIFFWGLFMVGYFSSFENTTTVTGTTQTFTISTNDYFFLTYLLPIVNGLLFIGAGLCLLEFIWLVSYSTWKAAVNSKL